MNNHVTVLEIDAKALLHNINYFRQKLLPETKILAVVKAFGYGSDAVEIAKTVQNEVDYFAVAYSSEGIPLRKAGIKTPILVLHPQMQNIKDIVEYQLEPNLYNFKIFDAFSSFAEENSLENYPIHIKFNTGLNRLGFYQTDIPEIILKFKNSNVVKVQSVFSHLAASEDLNEATFTNNQLNKFEKIVKQIHSNLGYKPMAHTLNTSGVINYSNAQYNMVRIGIGMYGFGNTSEVTALLKNTHSLKSIVSQIHTIPKGETIGYNRAFTTDRNTKIATVPIGHADGISRRLGNKKGQVTINNKIVPIIGNVCMDMIMVDVTEVDCKEGNEVIIFNHQSQINAMAAKSETISYEILTGLSQRIKRVIKK